MIQSRDRRTEKHLSLSVRVTCLPNLKMKLMYSWLRILLGVKLLYVCPLSCLITNVLSSDEGPLATTSLEDISADLEKHHRDMCQNSTLYQVGNIIMDLK